MGNKITKDLYAKVGSLLGDLDILKALSKNITTSKCNHDDLVVIVLLNIRIILIVIGRRQSSVG